MGKGTLIIFIIILFLTGTLIAKRQPVRTRNIDFGPNLQEELIRYGDRLLYQRTGKIAVWYNPNYRATGRTPEDMAYQFLDEYASLFGIKKALSDLEYIKTKKGINSYHIIYQQVYQGIPVYGSEIKVSLTDRGEIQKVTSGYKEGLKLDGVKPVISVDIAREKALEYLNPPRESAVTGTKEPELGILYYDGTARLVWKLYIVCKNPLGHWLIFVDALTGELISVKDIAMYSTGWGYTFDPDPITTAHTSYGTGGFIDNNDQDSPELNGEQVERTLQDITLDQSGYYRLEGPYIRIIDFEPPWEPTFKEEEPYFYYTRTEQGFEPVMVYYEIDNIQRYLQSLGFSDVNNESQKVDPHGAFGLDNSWYDPTFDYIAFGEGGVDDAEDADVIIHEYGHAMQHDQMGVDWAWSNNEGIAIGEGFGDYFAGSYSASIDTYQQNWVFNWDGHNPFWDGRILNSTKHYPEDIVGEPHADGEIWSACLWEIHNALGREIADRIIVQSHFYLWSWSDFRDAARAILRANYLLYGTEHLKTIFMIFYSRGILPMPKGGVIASAISKENLGGSLKGETGESMRDKFYIMLHPNPFKEQIEIEFSLYNIPSRFAVYDVSGKLVYILATRDELSRRYHLVWNGEDENGRLLPMGIYFLKIEAGEESILRKMIILR